MKTQTENIKTKTFDNLKQKIMDKIPLYFYENIEPELDEMENKEKKLISEKKIEKINIIKYVFLSSILSFSFGCVIGQKLKKN